jgi:hypothetical protein
MCLHNSVSRHTSFTLQTVDVLGEEFEQSSLLVEQADERMRHGRSVFPRIEFVSEGIEWMGISAKIRDIKHGFGVWKLQACKIGIQASIGRAKVGNASRSADARTSLGQSASKSNVHGIMRSP